MVHESVRRCFILFLVSRRQEDKVVLLSRDSDSNIEVRVCGLNEYIKFNINELSVHEYFREVKCGECV